MLKSAGPFVLFIIGRIVIEGKFVQFGIIQELRDCHVERQSNFVQRLDARILGHAVHDIVYG